MKISFPLSFLLCYAAVFTTNAYGSEESSSASTTKTAKSKYYPMRALQGKEQGAVKLWTPRPSAASCRWPPNPKVAAAAVVAVLLVVLLVVVVAGRLKRPQKVLWTPKPKPNTVTWRVGRLEKVLGIGIGRGVPQESLWIWIESSNSPLILWSAQC